MKRLIGVVAAVAVLGLAGWSVVRQLVSRRVETVEGGRVPVVVAPPRRGQIGRSLSYAGTLEPLAQVTLTPKVAGRIASIVVTEGQSVEAGDLVALMEDDTVRLQAEQAAFAYRAAQAQYDRAKKGARDGDRENAQALLAQTVEDVKTAEENYARLDRLYQEGTLSRSRWEDAERQLRAARTALDNARRDVEMLEQGASTEELDAAQAQMQAMQAQSELASLGLENARVTTPIAGRVARVHVDAGNMAGYATPIVTILTDALMVIRLPVPEKHYADVRSRLSSIVARVRPASLPGRVLDGRLSRVAPTVDPASRTFVVEIEVRNTGGLLQAGMYANVDLVLESLPDALLVPAAALVTRGGVVGVYVVRDGETARFVTPTWGLQTGESAQVLDGLAPDDRVIVEGAAFLEDGELVAPVDEP